MPARFAAVLLVITAGLVSCVTGQTAESTCRYFGDKNGAQDPARPCLDTSSDVATDTSLSVVYRDVFLEPQPDTEARMANARFTYEIHGKVLPLREL